MKMRGAIVTTLLEIVEVDLGDTTKIPHDEIGELFMKVAMTLSPKTTPSKHVHFVPIGFVAEPPEVVEFKND